METGARPLSWLRNAVVGAFSLALLAGILLPIYTDEVGWRLQERAGFDGFDKLLVELCGPNTVARPPFWMMPARYYSAIFNSLLPAPIYVRLSGILYALGWSALVLPLITRIAAGARERTALCTLAFGFMSLGTMPLLLVWSRPEQPIILSFTAAMLIASAGWTDDRPQTPAPAAWLRPLAILLLALVAMSYHVKAVFTVPLFLACLMFAARGPKAHIPRLSAAILLVGATAWAAQYWVHRLQCPNDLSLRADFARNNTGAALVAASGWSHIAPLIGKASDNISLFQYLGMPAPRGEPMSAWLPPGKIDFGSSFTWFLVIVLSWAAALLVSSVCLIRGAKRAWLERSLDPRLAMAALLFAGTLGWSATQGFRNVYEASFVIPMMVLAVVLSLSTCDRSPRLAARIELLAAGVGAMGILSIALVALLYGPALVAATRERGYLKAQPFSISAFGYTRLRRDMLSAGRKCGITEPDRNHALLLDDVTYFAFMKSRMPEHRNGLFSPTVSIKDPIAYLRGVKSDGAVVSCKYLPPAVRARARSQGEFCCLAPPNW